MQRHELISGIGNEVLWTFLCILVFVVGLICILRRWQYSPLSIHIGSQDVVATARRHLEHFSNRLVNDVNGTMTNSRHFGADNQCPICLQEPRYPIETNCGHLFCALCVILYWRHGNWRGAVRCPVCRQTVTVLLRCFREQDGTNSEERNQILHDVNDYNRRFSGEPRPWMDYLWDLPTLLRHVGSEFFSVGGLMYMFRLRIFLCFVAAIMYLVSPLDMIPEAVFGILGLLDDMFVVLLLAIYVTVIYRRFLANRYRDNT